LGRGRASDFDGFIIQTLVIITARFNENASKSPGRAAPKPLMSLMTSALVILSVTQHGRVVFKRVRGMGKRLEAVLELFGRAMRVC